MILTIVIKIENNDIAVEYSSEENISDVSEIEKTLLINQKKEDEYQINQIRNEYNIKRSKIDAWLRHLEKTEANSRRMKEIVKGLLQHARRIKAEVDLAKKKDAREPSIRNIRQSCLRMLKLDEEADEIDKEIGVRPDPL